MKCYVPIVLLLACLTSGADALGQRYTSEIKLDKPASQTIALSVDSPEIDVFLTGIATGKPISITLAELPATPASLSYTMPADLFGQAVAFPENATATQAIRISLTRDTYGVGSPTTAKNSDTDKKTTELIKRRPWQLPVQLLIKHNGKTAAVTIYKAYSFTGALLLDAARLDSLRGARDPALYALIRQYDSRVTGATKKEWRAYFEKKDKITLTSSRRDSTNKPLTWSDTLTRNPYLGALMAELEQDALFPEPASVSSTALQPVGAAGGGQAKSGVGGLGALSNPLLAADALATFIARRFKQEVNIAFLNEFREKLRIDTTLGMVFPRTKEIMLAIDPYEYTTFLESMKTAFEEDLGQLPAHSAALLDSLVARKKIRLPTDRMVLARVALLTLQRTLDDSSSYWGAMQNLPVADVKGGSDTLKSVLLTGSLLLNSVLDSTSRVRLPGVKALAKAGYTDLLLGLLLARYDTLLLQHIQMKLSNTGPIDPASFLSFALHTKTDAFDAGKLSDGANAFGKALLAFDAALRTLKNKQKADKEKEGKSSLGTTIVLDAKARDKSKLASYTDFAVTLTNALDQMLSTEELFPAIPAVRFRQRVLKPVNDGIQAFKHVQEKQYALAVIYTANMLVALTSRSDSIDSRTTVALKKYGSFMTSVVAAETRDQMLEALETAALPVGSYRIKRNNFFSVAINTYGGIATGRENVREITAPASASGVAGATNSYWLLSPYAPLGVSVAWGRNADYVNRKDHGSFGAHVNLLDVGALAAVRIADETVSLPEFTWKNLLAPGFQLIYGLPKSVWTVGLGAQLGPELRRVNLEQGQNVIDSRQWRIGLTFGADIPVFNVFTQANHRRIRTLRKSSLTIEAGRGAKEGK